MTAFKVVRFLTGAAAGDVGSRWGRVLATTEGARPGRPLRVAVAAPVTAPDFPPPAFAAVDIQWFATADDALANEDWLTAADHALRTAEESCRVVAEEHVVRGSDDGDQLWDGVGERYLMMSFGKRSPGLTLPQFLDRWRAEAGNLGGSAIREDVRGRAYVQNHPLVIEGHEWPFDAVNEVHCTQFDDLRRRRDWFAARQDAALRSPANHFMDPDRTGSLFLRARMSTTKET